ncbi:MAG: DUF3488 and transglutaminase-like domain-containing protein [Nocardioides sp.]
MTRGHATLAGTVLLPVVAAATTWVATFAWRGFTETPGGFLNPLLLLAIVVAGTGIALRWWRVPTPLTILAQAVAGGVAAMLLITGSPLPVGDGWVELTRAVDRAIDTAQRFAAPVPTQAPPIDALLILCGLLCLLLVDVLACTLHRVPLAGLPLLVVYTVPMSLIGDDVAWSVFAVTAAGFLTMLALQQSDQVTRWGRPIGVDRETGDPIAYGAGAHTARGTAGTIGGVATAFAVVLPALVPTVGVQLLDFGPGSGGGDEIRIDNPTTDLVRDFKAGKNTPLVEITTTEPSPSYLRILTLTRFSNVEWSPGNRDVPADNGATGGLPRPIGLASSIPKREVPYDVSVLPAFSSTWLPTQAPVSRVLATSDWRYDDETMDFLAVPDDLTTSGLDYSMTAIEADIDGEDLDTAGSSAGRVSEVFTDVPGDLPVIVRKLAAEVTEDETGRYEQAVALQNWFRSSFEYSLDTAEGSGYDALVRFLTDEPGGRIGYCEQFASAMAVMARVLGIPARVSLGFLAPTQTGQNSWVYSARDLHTWPELYFDGAGWVRFEPTPAARVPEVPEYTRFGDGPDEAPSQTADPSEAESSDLASNRPRVEETDDTTGATAGSSSGGRSWLGAGVAAVGVALAAVALLLPRSLRRRRREHRLEAGDPELAWAELRDTALDLGVTWPEGRSPRATRALLVEHLGSPLDPQTPDRPAHGAAVAPVAVESLDRLVHHVELRRYARPGSVADPDRDQVRDDAHTVLAALMGGATRRSRRRAQWWPRSVLRPGRRSRRTTSISIETTHGAVVDHAS